MLAESHVRGQGKAVKRCYIQRRAAWYSRSLAIVLERPARVVARRVGHDDLLLLYYTLSCVDIIGRERRREGAFNNPERRNWVKATRRLEKRHVTFLIYQKKRKNGEERRISLRVVCVCFFLFCWYFHLDWSARLAARERRHRFHTADRYGDVRMWRGPIIHLSVPSFSLIFYVDALYRVCLVALFDGFVFN